MDTRISASAGLAQKPQQTFTAPLRLGDVLEARVLTQSGNQVSLKVGQQVLSGLLVGRQANIAATAKFQVVRLEPVPVLKIVNPNQSAATSAMSRFVRDALPTQRPLQALFSLLNDAKHQGQQSAENGSTKSQSGLLHRTVTNIEKHAVSLRDIATADGLRSAIKNSGVFFESQLPQMLINHSKYLNFSDLKATLLRAHERLSSVVNQRSPRAGQIPLAPQQASPSNIDESLGSLMKAVEASLARIETLQLANHTLATTGHNDTYLEIPIRLGDQFEIIRLLLEQEHEQADGRENTEHPQSASIYLEIAISDNESLQAKASINAEQVSITLWSESERIQQRLRGRAAELEIAVASSTAGNTTIAIQRFHNKILDPARLFSELVRDTA